MELADLQCPQCGSERLYRDGLRYLADGSPVQRWLCRSCGYRFTDPEYKAAQKQWKNPPYSLNLQNSLDHNCQGNNDPNGRVPSALEAVQTLAEVESQIEKRAAGATKQITDSRGKIVEYLWYLKKQGRSEITITGYRQRLFQMLKEGIDLLNPDAVKEYLAKKSCSNRTKAIDVCIYDGFLKFLKMSWDPPIYKPERTLPFIPTEQEIDQLIAAVGRRLAVFLQLLKETGMRCGEAARLKWIDIDFERKTIRVTPEKGSDPRILPISDKLVEMLKNIPKKSEQVFSATLDSISSNFYLQRKKIARKLGNPRLLNISFHTLRHWKGTIEYHKTKDPYHVKQVLGHRRMDSTMLYINIEQAIFQNAPSEEFHVRVAQKATEIKELLEAGFEYVLQKDGLAYFRKRK